MTQEKSVKLKIDLYRDKVWRLGRKDIALWAKIKSPNLHVIWALQREERENEEYKIYK